MPGVRHVSPSRAVLVRRDSQWYPGHVEAWRREDGAWLAFVRYSVGVGAVHLDWLDAAHLRPV